MGGGDIAAADASGTEATVNKANDSAEPLDGLVMLNSLACFCQPVIPIPRILPGSIVWPLPFESSKCVP